jgi:hypothetical protein
MSTALDQLVAGYNDAADRYNLARLEYALQAVAEPLPPPAGRLRRTEASPGPTPPDRPLAFNVEDIRDFFEAHRAGGGLPGAAKFMLLRESARELVRRFLQVSLTLLGVCCNGIIDQV